MGLHSWHGMMGARKDVDKDSVKELHCLGRVIVKTMLCLFVVKKMLPLSFSTLQTMASILHLRPRTVASN